MAARFSPFLSSHSRRRRGRAEARPDDVLGLVADQFEVQLETKSVQRQVPQTSQFAHLVREGVQVRVPAHVQGAQGLQQADLWRDLGGKGGGGTSLSVLVLD